MKKDSTDKQPVWLKLKTKIGALPLAATVVLAFFFAFSVQRLKWRMYFFVFQERDIHRALELLAGKLIFFGPEMTGGGNLPGPFYYVLLASALFFDPSWESAWLCLILLMLAAGLIGWIYFFRRFSMLIGFVWLALFGMASTTGRIVGHFINASYVMPFVVPALICICTAFSPAPDRMRKICFVAACLLIGLSIQLHFSVVCLMFAILVLQWLAPRWNAPRIETRAFWLGMAFFLLPSLPYIVWRSLEAHGFPFGQENSNAGRPEQALPSLFLLMDFIRALPTAQLVKEAVIHLVETIPAAFFPLALTYAVFRARPADAEFAGVSRWLRGQFLLPPLIVCAIAGFVPFSYWFFAPIGGRYGSVFYISMILISVLLLRGVFESRRMARFYCVAVAGVFLLMTSYFVFQHKDVIPLQMFGGLAVLGLFPIAACLVFDRNSVEKAAGRPLVFLSAALTIVTAGIQQRMVHAGDFLTMPSLMPSRLAWDIIWYNVYTRTGWSYDEAIHRLYFIDHHIEQDARPVYREIAREYKPFVGEDDVVPDGFFISVLHSGMGMTPEATRRWLLKQTIHKDVRQALEQGGLRLGRPLPGNLLIAPYFVVDRELLPESFHSYGQGYLRAPEEALLDDLPESEGTRPLSENELLFKWNECPDRHKLCSTGAIVKVSRETADTYRFDVKVFGSVISQVSPWITPYWTQQWINPYLEVECGSGPVRRRLASSIGYGREYATYPTTHALLWGNNSIVAPFKRSFRIECRKPPAALTLGREGSQVEVLYQILKIGPKRLTVNLPSGARF